MLALATLALGACPGGDKDEAEVTPAPAAVAEDAAIAKAAAATPDAEPTEAAAPTAPAAVVEALTAVGRGGRPCAELTGRYEDGNGLEGYTYITLAAGKVDVRRTRPGADDERYSGELLEDECRALAKGAVADALWTVKRERDTGLPDETQPKIGLGVDGVGGFEVVTWDNDAPDQPAFMATRKRLLAISKRVSGGKVTY